MNEDEQEPMSVYMLAAMAAQQFAEVAWQKLGLQPDMFTQKIEKNLPEAKVAIDLVTHITATVESELDEEDRRQMQNLVANLRLNYVQKSAEDATS